MNAALVEALKKYLKLFVKCLSVDVYRYVFLLEEIISGEYQNYYDKMYSNR